jgi:methylation protein EvaC
VSPSPIRTVSACRLCKGEELHLLALRPEVPVAGIYLDRDDPREGPRSALTFLQCSACGLVQLAESLDPEIYRRYPFAGATSTGYRGWLEELASELPVAPGTRALEIGCGDGTLLSLLRDRGAEALGYEPSGITSARAREAGLDVREAFFDPATSEDLPAGAFDLLVARHVLEHVDDFDSIFAAFGRLASPGARLVIEVPDLDATVAARLYGNLYHAHQVYFERQSLEALLHRHGWSISELREVDIFGGSILALARRGEAGEIGLAAGLWEEDEGQEDAIHGDPWAPTGGMASFFAGWGAWLDGLREALDLQIGAGLVVEGYGAAERTGAVLGAAGIGVDRISRLYDRNPALQGRKLAGTGIPIHDPEDIGGGPDRVLAILATSHEAEIRAQLEDFEARGGRFLTLKTDPPSLLAHER